MSASLSGITNTRLIGPVAVAIAVAAMAVANFAGNGDNGGAGPFAAAAVVAIVAGALLFGRVVPRAIEGDRPARTALVLAALSVVTLLAFWIGLPQVLAPAAIVLGLAAPRSGEATAAVAIGSVAYVLSLVAAVVG
jgi:CBS domain containing-hemolysin-like protein